MPNYYTGTDEPLRTEGKAPRKRMLHDEKIVKKRLGNPVLWRQLEAISRGTFVNHLGRGHARTETAGSQFSGPAPKRTCNQCATGEQHVHLG